jgi:hypothetical protein
LINLPYIYLNINKIYILYIMITARKPRSDKKPLTPYELQLSQMLRERGKIGGGTYSETTIKNYVSKCRLAHQKVHPEEVFEDIEWTKDFENVKKKLNEDIPDKGKPSVSQLGGFYNAIIMITSLYEDYPSDIQNHYEVIRDSLRNQANTTYAQGGTEKKKETLEAVSKEAIESMLQKLSKSKKRKEFMIYLMMKFTIMFSLRNEIASVRLRIAKTLPVDAAEGNWLVKLSAKKYVLVRNNYKTGKNYGTKTNEITGIPFISRLNKWIKTQDIKDGDLLFTAFDAGRKTELKSYDISHYFGDITKEYLDHKISSSLLASIYSETVPDLSTASLEDTTGMKKQADNRGHTIKTKLMVYDQNKSK